MIKYLIMDIDGTLTDGKIYMGPLGEAMKAFSVKDGYVFNFILKPIGIVPIIITARVSSIVKCRCDELGIENLFQGKLDKLTTLKEVVGKENFKECAYLGDDLLDYRCMTLIKEAGGIVGCPSDAAKEIKAISNYVCLNKAGEGALREFSEWLVSSRVDEAEITRKVNEAVLYLKGLNITVDDVGKHIVNENFFYCVQSYKTKPVEDCKLKSHRRYIDIQIMVKGFEAIDIVDINRLILSEEYDMESDIAFWKIPSRMVRIMLREGDYIVLYPENAHRDAVSVNDNANVLKIVGKMN